MAEGWPKSLKYGGGLEGDMPCTRLIRRGRARCWRFDQNRGKRAFGWRIVPKKAPCGERKLMTICAVKSGSPALDLIVTVPLQTVLQGQDGERSSQTRSEEERVVDFTKGEIGTGRTVTLSPPARVNDRKKASSQFAAQKKREGRFELKILKGGRSDKSKRSLGGGSPAQRRRETRTINLFSGERKKSPIFILVLQQQEDGLAGKGRKGAGLDGGNSNTLLISRITSRRGPILEGKSAERENRGELAKRLSRS